MAAAARALTLARPIRRHTPPPGDFMGDIIDVTDATFEAEVRAHAVVAQILQAVAAMAVLAEGLGAALERLLIGQIDAGKKGDGFRSLFGQVEANGLPTFTAQMQSDRATQGSGRAGNNDAFGGCGSLGQFSLSLAKISQLQCRLRSAPTINPAALHRCQRADS